ncbi:MAG: hypothetical protein ACP5KP_00325 [Candidatus Micrarchaeia archaeon]
MRYKINKWFVSYEIPEEWIDEFESLAFSMKLKMEVRYRYVRGSAQWKNLDRVFFYDGEKRSEGNTKAKIINKENGRYELVIFDEKIDEKWNERRNK